MENHNKIFWLVSNGHHKVIIQALNREFAKARSYPMLGGNPDNYTWTPLTEVGDFVYIQVEVPYNA